MATKKKLNPMDSLLWDGTGIYKKDNRLVTAPGECCCCVQECPVPSGFGTCTGIAWAQCSGTGCWESDFSDCLTNLPSALETQGYHILNSGDLCCNCSGFALHDVYACCSGYIETDGTNDLLIPVNISGDCTLCNGIQVITIDNIDDEYFWRIPKCNTVVYYCVLEDL